MHWGSFIAGAVFGVFAVLGWLKARTVRP